MKLARLIDRKAPGATDAEIVARMEPPMSAPAFGRLRRGDTPDPHLSTVESILRAIRATWTDYDRA